MAELIKNNEAANLLGMTAPAFAKGAKSGRFTVAGHDKNGHALYDPDVIRAEYEATAAAANIQNHARIMPEGMRGGRPKGKRAASPQLELFAAENLQSLEKNGGDKTSAAKTNQDQFLAIKLETAETQKKLLKMKAAREAGKLILKSEAEKQGIELGEIMMGIISAWPVRMAQEFAAMGERGSDSHEFQSRLHEECNNLIKEICKHCGYNDGQSENL